mgnify:CR=1 FL=1
MGQTTGISWTDHTFNPHIGCSKVHAGCAHCYAERDFDTRRGVAPWGPHGTRIVTSEANWKQPSKWNREAEAAGERRRVFCASLADVFEDWKGPIGGVTRNWISLDDVRRELFAVIDSTPFLDWLLLTKRPENIRRMWSPMLHAEVQPEMHFRANVWLGTSVSNDETADEQIPHLMKCRDLSPVLFLSAEPLLGPLDISLWTPNGSSDPSAFREMMPCVDWVIAGGESGAGFRFVDPDWLRGLRDQCQAGDVPFFFKQWSGSNPKTLGKILDGREWCEFPNVSVSV